MPSCIWGLVVEAAPLPAPGSWKADLGRSGSGPGEESGAAGSGPRLWVGAALASASGPQALALHRGSLPGASEPHVLFYFNYLFLGRFGLISIFKCIHYYF